MEQTVRKSDDGGGDNGSSEQFLMLVASSNDYHFEIIIRVSSVTVYPITSAELLFSPISKHVVNMVVNVGSQQSYYVWSQQNNLKPEY